MVNEINQLVDEYAAWLKQRTKFREVRGWVEIVTPFLDRHNDRIVIYAKVEDNAIHLTDDGYILGDLEMSGLVFDTPRRKEILETTLRGHNVHLVDGRLEAKASRERFPWVKHNFVQALLAVNDLVYLAAPNVKALFQEDVARWLDMHDIRYSPSIKVAGRSGYDHRFDFLIPKSKAMPERMIRAIVSPSKDAAELLIFSWEDTKTERAANAKLYAVLNDTQKKVNPGIVDALNIYGITPVRWSEREEHLEELSA